MKTKSLLALGALLLGTATQAAVIAVIDSGTDIKHHDLKNKLWTNAADPDDAVDNDNNHYIDDTHGWNFADGNNKLIDKKFLGTFSPDVYKYFEVQLRLLKGQGSAEDLAWIKAKQADQDFIGELSTFANFVHGTHVAGIASRNADDAQIMGIKIIPTKAPTIGGGGHHRLLSYFNTEAKTPDKVIRTGLKLLASQQAKMLAPVGQYVDEQKARVANCSFGTSTMAARTILGPILKLVLRRDPTTEELNTYSAFFVDQILAVSKKALIDQAPNALYVIAAGNDGTNNDQLPTSPANIKTQNTITVAATQDYSKLASFSNYGENMVEVAAPGVGILSSIPGNDHITVSGTSQASPFVAGVAGMVLDENPSLSNSDVKRVLMQTVDAKSFLSGKVSSGGIVNTARAIRAAKLSVTMGLGDAIRAAKLQIGDVAPSAQREAMNGYEGFVMPLPSLLDY